jgi:hypothetical protein
VQSTDSRPGSCNSCMYLAPGDLVSRLSKLSCCHYRQVSTRCVSTESIESARVARPVGTCDLQGNIRIQYPGFEKPTSYTASERSREGNLFVRWVHYSPSQDTWCRITLNSRHDCPVIEIVGDGRCAAFFGEETGPCDFAGVADTVRACESSESRAELVYSSSDVILGCLASD